MLFFPDLMTKLFRGTEIPVDEVPLQVILNKGLGRNPQWSHHVQSMEPLKLTLPRLVHAIIKAETLKPREYSGHYLSTLLQMFFFLQLWSNHLGMHREVLNNYADFMRSNLAGRVGQGLALLFAQHRGYAFSGHLQQIIHDQCKGCKVKTSMADFVVDNSKTKCILEAKGSFSVKNSLTQTKRLLHDALVEQVGPWMARITPPASKALVVASYIRDLTVCTEPPSVLAFVETDQNGINTLHSKKKTSFEQMKVDLSSEDIKRYNYAGWLRAMGLTAAAQRLQFRTSEGVNSTPVTVVKVRNQDIMFPMFPSTNFVGLSWSRDVLEYLYFITHILHIRDFSSEIVIPLLGIERKTLEKISKAIQGRPESLSEILIGDSDEDSNTSAEATHYSLFPDHTCFYLASPEDFERSFRDIVSVQL